MDFTDRLTRCPAIVQGRDPDGPDWELCDQEIEVFFTLSGIGHYEVFFRCGHTVDDMRDGLKHQDEY